MEFNHHCTRLSSLGHITPAQDQIFSLLLYSKLQYVPICGAFWPNGTSYQCPTGYQLMSSQVNATSPSDTVCCEYVPLCGAYWANGTSYQCPSGTELKLANIASTTTDDASCCQGENQRGRNLSMHACNAHGRCQATGL